MEGERQAYFVGAAGDRPPDDLRLRIYRELLKHYALDVTQAICNAIDPAIDAWTYALPQAP